MKLSRTPLKLLAATAIAFTALTGCSSNEAKQPTTSAEKVADSVVVKALDNKYEPRKVEIKTGQTVTWEFAGNVKHDVIDPNGLFRSPLMKEGTFSHKFTKAGTYTYKCSLHPEMIGTIVVTD
ncbi:MAG: cupredoxin domain-containing protein [Microbacteriaceae bacterium]|nr:cupredoxin domain-containing protein [Microbacteriaceae bacterium]